MRGKRLVPVVLAVLWILIAVWQYYEHQRFLIGGRDAFENRTQDITNTLAVVIRSQRLFGGWVDQARLEIALSDLVQSDPLESIVLFNSLGEVIVSVGKPLTVSIQDVVNAGSIWNKDSVTLVNLVDLGIDPRREREEPTIVISEEERDQMRQMRPRPDRGGRSDTAPELEAPPAQGERERNWRNDDNSPGRRGRGRPFRRPPWMSEGDYQTLITKAGITGFIITMSTEPFNFAKAKGLQIRFLILALSSVAILGFYFAWRNLLRSSELQLRLVRANEMNRYLKEMNLAAAGLAHETRNPLNLVRGLAQVIGKDDAVSGTTKTKALQITEEVDRVTAQLNEFINYSKPCVPKPVPVAISTVVRDVEQALHSDLEDQNIALTIEIPEWTIEADEGMLRQIVFNLLLNAIQAIESDGTIVIRLREDTVNRASLTIEDSGPGIDSDMMERIFQPYFTTKDKGTGLGLAVVKQIVSAHGWEIACLAGGGSGAMFVIKGMHVVPDAG